MKFDKLIFDYFGNKYFVEKLSQINVNYFNLKQESFIRNTVLEYLNVFFDENSLPYRALAERRNKNRRIDLCIVNFISKQTYNIEFKFHFSNDLGRPVSDHYVGYVNKDYADRGSDMFILVAVHFDMTDKLEYDSKYGIEKQNSLAKYVNEKNETWSESFRKPFYEYNALTTNSCPSEIRSRVVEIPVPYTTQYHFFCISKMSGNATDER